MYPHGEPAHYSGLRRAKKVVCAPTGGDERRLARRLRESVFPVQPAHPNRVRVGPGRRRRSQNRPAGCPATGLLRSDVAGAGTPAGATGTSGISGAAAPSPATGGSTGAGTEPAGPGTGGQRAPVQPTPYRRAGSGNRSTGQEHRNRLRRQAALAQPAARYRTVPGLGPVAAATLVAVPALGHWDDKTLTDLVGLAPWSRHSGQQQGQRSIRGGRGWCAPFVIWPRCRQFGPLSGSAPASNDCANAARRAKSPWWHCCENCCCAGTRSPVGVHHGARNPYPQPKAPLTHDTDTLSLRVA